MMPRVAYALVVLGGDPEPIGADIMAELVISLRRGRTLLLMADRRDLRDRAKAEILAMAAKTGARA